jgi:hypothetical protein
MTVPNSTHNDGAVQLPKRPEPVPQLSTARQRADGTVEPEGPGRIRPDEVIAPTRWWASGDRVSIHDIENAIDWAVQPLKDLLPPCSMATDAVGKLIRNQIVLGQSDEDTVKLWLLVHSPSLSLQDMGRALASALFRDKTAFIIADCSVPENSKDQLFGAPPGYKGCLEGGFLTNQLKIRPESMVILSNFEYAEEGTLNVVHNFTRWGTGFALVARGAEVCDVSGRDALFVLATTRAFSDINSDVPHRTTSAAREKLQASLQAARPELDWSYYYTIEAAEICIWG